MGGRVKQLLVLAGFVVTMFVPAMARAEGEITAYPIDGGGRFLSIASADGSLWVGGNSSLWQVGTDGAAIWQVPGISSVEQITAGPDGAAWFAGSDNGSIIGRVTGAEDLTEYPLPDGSDVSALVTGPDGALWFVNDTSTTDTLDRMTTNGVITDAFPLPTANASASPIGGLATGSDGALWLTRFRPSTTDNTVVRVTVTGQITEYPLPTLDGYQLQGITAGPDGALWFVASVGLPNGIIGRITTDGQATIYPVNAFTQTGITTGSDGAIWFTEIDADEMAGVGRITTSGDVTIYPGPSGVRTTTVTTGPDGAIWFADRGSVVYRLVPPDVTAPTISGAAFNPNPKSILRGNAMLSAQVSDESGVASVEYYDPVQGTWQPMGLSGSTASATVSTPLLRYPADRYPFQIRATDSAGNVSAPVTVYLNVYSPLGSTTGQGTVNPNGATSDPGDTLPVETGPNVRASFDFTVQSTLFSSIPTGSSTFTWGSNCNRRTSNCFAVNTSSLQWLVVNNASHTAVFQGLATLTQGSSNLGGNYVVRVTASNGAPASHYLLQVYAPGSDPDNSTPVYQASGNLASGHVTL